MSYRLYFWTEEDAIEQLKSEHLTCLDCGQKIISYPLEDKFRHMLIHAQDDMREAIEDMIAMLCDKDKSRLFADFMLQKMSDPIYVGYFLELGLLVTLDGERNFNHGAA